METFEEILRRLAVNDRRFIAHELSCDRGPQVACGLEAKSRAIVRVAALAVHGGSAHTFRWTIGDALVAGVRPDEIVGILLAVIQLVGIATIADIAPKVALALDYDLDAALEHLEA